MKIEKQQIVNWIFLCAKTIAENEKSLSDFDRDLGDADHGFNLNRGFQLIAKSLHLVERQNISTILKNTGMVLHSNVGGASGPLYGTLFLRSANTLGSREKISLEQLINALKNGVDGIASRGKAKLGEKTMLDVWLPALDVAKEKLHSGCTMDHALNCMLNTAKKSTLATIEMQAYKGRAKNLGIKSIGLQDPGATSSLLIIQALYKALTSAPQQIMNK